MPGFVLGGRRSRTDRVPVFVFHDVAPAPFERQLRFLRSNGYRTLSADELAESFPYEHALDRTVALTFDDATWTFWTFAFPLLRRYGFRAILFAISALVPEDHRRYPNLDDVAAGQCALADLDLRAKAQPLCTWCELAAMHASGVVDVQSHSATHALVPISPRVVDFLRPDFDAKPFGNVNVPLSALDDPRRPERRLRLGAPVFESASRLAGRARFKEASELIEALTGHVETNGGAEFFRTRGWRKRLLRLLAKWPGRCRGTYETEAEMEQWLWFECADSQRRLESRLTGARVRHFCYPWFQGSALADRIAAEAGYQTVHEGIFSRQRERSATPLAVPRISADYLLTLPGSGRLSFWSTWGRRLGGHVRGERVRAL